MLNIVKWCLVGCYGFWGNKNNDFGGPTADNVDAGRGLLN